MMYLKQFMTAWYSVSVPAEFDGRRSLATCVCVCVCLQAFCSVCVLVYKQTYEDLLVDTYMW